MKKWNYVLAGVLGTSLILGGTTGFAKNVTERITASFAGIKLIVNGQEIKTSAEPFIYNKNVYAPVATVANALGVKEEWDNKERAVRFTDPNKPSEDGHTFDTAMGKGVHLITYKTAEFSWSLRDNYLNKEIPLPHTEGKQVFFQSPVVRTFINATGQGKNEFVMSEVVQLGEGYEKYLHLFRYENGKLTSLGSVKYEDFSKVSATVAMFNQDDRTFYVNFYKDKKLVGVSTYQWKGGQLVKTNELKQ